MAKVKTLCEEALRPVIENMGYELVEVSYQKDFSGMVLLITIDCEKGVALEDCENVSRTIDPILDELNPTADQPYTLMVSSPGIDRPLKTDRDFERNMGKEIEITLFQKLGGKKVFKGKLNFFSENEIELEMEGEKLTLEKNKIAHIVPIIKF